MLSISMKDLGAYLRGMQVRRATQVRGTVKSKNTDGSYMVEREDTLVEIIAQRGDFGGDFSAGQMVTLSIPDRSGATSGTGYTIIARQTTNSRNSSLASRYTNQVNNGAEAFSRITVAGVNVDSVTLVKGGAAETIEIYGTGLSSDATYSNAGITDNVAQDHHGGTVQLTLAPKASGGMAVGRYDLTVAGVTLTNFFSVIA